jgi:hypothetical protein
MIHFSLELNRFDSLFKDQESIVLDVLCGAECAGFKPCALFAATGNL